MRKVIVAPSTYIQGNGELKKLASRSLDLACKKALIIVDPYIRKIYEKDILSSFQNDGVPYIIKTFGGECCEENIAEYVSNMQDADVVIGIGGGKTLDTAKTVADRKKVPVMIVPTSASTDAPCSRMAVLYKCDGSKDKNVFFKSNPNMVLMDLDVIVAAPVRFLVSGMGDAMATYYEAMASTRTGKITLAGGHTSKTAIAIATLCRDILLEDGLKAKIACENKACCEAFENVVEANTYLSGLGFENAGASAAHSISNGIAAIEETHRFLHGEKVAFGVVCQLIMENRSYEEFKTIVSFFKQVGLPVCFKDLGIEEVSDEKLMEAAELTCAKGAAIYSMYQEITPEYVFNVMKATDALALKVQ